ncbi:sigma-70 family RNA polymerase sigma factor [Streptomyces sp. CHA1]|nr:sigma-70 family RNA polymerase sigma factor [Streptomyces sp. CHB9.2]MCO6707425.1 sigma-70 family RNA polymerase sigma factor [Streptomyces sp. CHA3]MCO6713162.1 sigma-70 family RNA polymerase sigma factor [Streptomyces sp. CHB19.2]MCO6719490.1 sigma-70 family RNA polymerase sigma factor [Streptomyces sp. Vc714c-19]MCO6725056.1 sigma-70 family RNA polymerase sigma factor [Streptomyces sp. CHA16]MCO6731146.1 sigma-70 family RNA polymerase sigma factor [Streptomyces sp. EL9]MCO6736829.1 sigm
MAFRFLGSIHDAEDAVQSAWIKASTAAVDDLRNPAAWLTTVLTRVCLDQLRMRQRRREEPLLTERLPAEALAADERYLNRENISRALMVVLDLLTPAQRVAYVLHDLFDVPFREVAETLGTSPDSAKKHASRARKRIEQAEPASTASIDNAVVEAFLSAAAGGDINRMVALMTDDCMRVVDPALVPPGTPPVVTGAHAVAEETTLFASRIRASTPILVDRRPVHVIAPGGHPLAVIDITTRNQRVARININRASVHAVLATPSTTS